jgi:hypothetical protein
MVIRYKMEFGNNLDVQEKARSGIRTNYMHFDKKKVE